MFDQAKSTLPCWPRGRRFVLGAYLSVMVFKLGLMKSSGEQLLTGHWASLVPLISTSFVPLQEIVANGRRKASAARMANALLTIGMTAPWRNPGLARFQEKLS